MRSGGAVHRKHIVTRRRITGRPGLTAGIIGTTLVGMSLCVSTGRMVYEGGGVGGPDVPSSKGSLSLADRVESQPMSDTAEKAADMLNAVSGPREVAGVSVSDNGRRQIIDLFKRAGLTESQAITIVDRGVLPASLASAKPTTAVAAQFGRMDPAVKAALATLKPKPGSSEARKNSNVSGNEHVSVIPSPSPTPTARLD